MLVLLVVQHGSWRLLFFSCWVMAFFLEKKISGKAGLYFFSLVYSLEPVYIIVPRRIWGSHFSSRVWVWVNHLCFSLSSFCFLPRLLSWRMLISIPRQIMGGVGSWSSTPLGVATARILRPLGKNWLQIWHLIQIIMLPISTALKTRKLAINLM